MHWDIADHGNIYAGSYRNRKRAKTSGYIGSNPVLNSQKQYLTTIKYFKVIGQVSLRSRADEVNACLIVIVSVRTTEKLDQLGHFYVQRNTSKRDAYEQKAIHPV